MPFLGCRVSFATEKALNRMSKETGLAKSEIIRQSMETHLMSYYTDDEETDWKITAWTFLGVDAHKINHALARAQNAEEFFSFIARWVKRFDLNLIPSRDAVTVKIKSGYTEIQTSCPKTMGKTAIIKTIILTLEEKFTEKAAQ